MEMNQEKAKEILKALIYQEMVEDTNADLDGKELKKNKPLIEEFAVFLGLSEDDLDAVYEEVFKNIDDFENNIFWDNFSEKIALTKRQKEEADTQGKTIAEDEEFEKIAKYMDEVDDKLGEADQSDLWQYITRYFE